MFPLDGMKNSLKISETRGENGFHYLKNEFTLARIKSVFKQWFPLVSVTFSASRKELTSKVDGFHCRENFSLIAAKKDSLKNRFPLDGKRLWVVLARKSVSTTHNEAFIEIYVSTIRKKSFFWQKSQKWFPLAGK